MRISRASLFFGLFIVLMLFCLAPLWVLNQRTEQRNLTCRRHQQQIALAFQRFDEDQGRLPGFRESRFGRPVADEEAEAAPRVDEAIARVAWPFHLLPYLYESEPQEGDATPSWHAIYKNFGPAARGANREVRPEGQIPLLLCPDDPQREGTAPLTFIANAGQPDREEPPGDHLANGVLMDTAAGQSSWSIRELAAADGISTTILLTENIDAGDWNDGNNEALVAVLWRPLKDTPAAPRWINERIGERKSDSLYTPFARPSAYHRWGVNTTTVDSATRTITPAIDRRAYLQMLAPLDDDVVDNRTGQPLVNWNVE